MCSPQSVCSGQRAVRNQFSPTVDFGNQMQDSKHFYPHVFLLVPVFCFALFCLEIGFHSVAQAGLELTM